MSSNSRVAVLFTRPETVLQDYTRLFELAGGRQALQPGVPTILKDNITWHFPMPGALPPPGAPSSANTNSVEPYNNNG